MKRLVVGVVVSMLAACALAAAVQCSGLTKKGARCRNRTTNASGYCYLHVSQAPKQVDADGASPLQ